jgi:ribonuclease HII
MPGPFNPAEAAAYPALIGCDEVGRGALCGPVVVAAVWFDPCRICPELLGALDDSKRLTAKQRERVYGLVMASARVALAAGSASIIDRYGIRGATLKAMRCAIERLGIDAAARIDGLDVPPGLAVQALPVVRGDSIVPQIAAASVVAKVCRDRLMSLLGARHPHYGWEHNAGYGTAQHLAALRLHGPTVHHRRSFAPVSMSADLLDGDAGSYADRKSGRTGAAGAATPRAGVRSPRMAALAGDGR